MIYLTEDEDRHIHDFCNQYNTTFTAQIASKLILINKSQKEEIEEFKEFQSEVADEYSWMNRLLNSYLKSENKLIAEIESLKAITELAVKGLQRISEMEFVEGDSTPEMRIAIKTLAEIERLSQ